MLEPQTVREYVELMRTGALSAEKLLQHHFDLIDQSESEVQAWAHLDRDHALQQARELDDIRRAGFAVGPLHGVPVGIKDIFDTADMPTQRGSAIEAGRQPALNSAVVEKLREAGALIMGKTVTTEFAFMHPSITRNPHNEKYSPGGSSSGSAAAVAAAHVPLSIGSQTNGSVIRPASFCGVYGCKPSAGLISRRGALETSNTLDQVGYFARDLGDLALLGDVLSGYDHLDNASNPQPKPNMLEGYLSDVPVEPSYVWIDMPYQTQYSESAAAGFEELLDELGDRVERISAPQSFSALIPCHKIIHEYEILRALETLYKDNWDQISDTIKPTLEAARAHTDELYQEALEIRTAAQQWFATFFNDYDAVLTPSALEEPPLFGSTGDPICCTVWTLCGLPCINLPLLAGEADMPIGVQLVGAYNKDDRLFRTARHFLKTLHSLNEGSE